jgi:hypothetical protein
MSATTRLRPEPRLIKYANIEDAATGHAYEEFRFRKTLGRTGRLRLKRNDARDCRTVLDALALKNAILPADNKKAKAWVQEAIKSEPTRYRRHMARLGWSRYGDRFALWDRVLGAPGRRQSLRPPMMNGSQLPAFRSRGTLEQWQKHVAKPASNSTALTLMVSAEFAAPLLQFSGLQNFGINFFGLSKLGKTAGLLASVSAIGLGVERDLPNWNTTSNAFLESAMGFHDLLFPMDEAGLIAGKRSDAYSVIRHFIYAFSEGRDRARHSSSSAAVAPRRATWCGIFISTSELSFNEYAAISGETRKGGEFARCLDVPILAAGHETIFDRTPIKRGTRQQERWARAALAKLRRHCDLYRGTAIEPYILYLIGLGPRLADKVKKYLDEFMIAVIAMHLDGALEHAGRNCALIYAGGCLAIDAKVLPWSKAELFDAVLAAFRSAVEEIQGHTNVLDKARSILREKLRSSHISQFRPGRTITPEDSQGYWERKGGVKVYTIHAKAFRDWFSSRAQVVALLRWLSNRGKLIVETGQLRRSPISMNSASRACRWPGYKPVKSIKLRDPLQ